MDEVRTEKPAPPSRGRASAPLPGKAAAPGGPAGAGVHQPVNILLVDDNPSKLLALETALAPLGERLIKASSGAEALRELLAREYAVIILDVSMPVMDGFETARTIRGRPRSANTPIIFASAINLAETDALRGYSLGAVDYILAPIVPEILRAKVSVFVQLYRKTEEARRQAEELEERSRQLEESQTQLRLAERMASLGTLAAGLGHDMGNLLLPIQTRLESIDTSGLPEDIRESLAGLSTTISYLRRLSSGLRLLAMGPNEAAAEPSGMRHTTELGPWWHEVEPMLRNVLPRSVELTFECEADLPPVVLAKHLLTQVVFNLVQNAGDVLREQSGSRGGKGNGRAGKVRVSAAAAPDGAHVVLRVADDGPGMPAEVRQRCMEPFFTTKSRTFSTGLGLAMVNGIIQRCGGTVGVLSHIGQGTTFTCRIPAVTAEGEGGDAALAPAATISLADPRMRAVVSSLLRVHGYKVGSEEQDGASLLVVDGGEDVAGRAKAFLSGDDRRQMLVFGDADGLSLGSRVHILQKRATVPEVRSAIAGLARQRQPGSAAPSAPVPQSLAD